jgi:CPA1 family monovalent cation:H+ antiporter
MPLVETAALLVVLSAVLGWINGVFIGLPQSIGLMAMGLVGSIALIAADHFVPGFGFADDLHAAVTGIDFFSTLMSGMLSFLLFASALHLDVSVMSRLKAPIILMATVGVLISTVLVGGALWLGGMLVGVEIPLHWALVFGALISPTDPVAVLSVLKKVKVPRALEAKIAGESLFNDGMGIIAFTVLLAVALAASGIHQTTGHEGLLDADGAMDLLSVAKLFSIEVFGSILLGLAAGAVSMFMIRRVDDAPLEILISLATVLGTYVLATKLHVSAPIAVVVPGIIIGNWGVTLAMSERTRDHLLPFWHIVDELLNSVLFLLIGLEVLVLGFALDHVALAALCIPIVLLARFVSVGAPVAFLRALRYTFSVGSVRIMTWGGVRGGISVALALSIPENEHKATILTATYVVVVFSILVQGLTMGTYIRALDRFAKAGPAE